jgi:hypothetical protein
LTENRQVHIGIHFCQIFEENFSAQYDGGLESIDFVRFKWAEFGSGSFEERRTKSNISEIL